MVLLRELLQVYICFPVVRMIVGFMAYLRVLVPNSEVLHVLIVLRIQTVGFVTMPTAFLIAGLEVLQVQVALIVN